MHRIVEVLAYDAQWPAQFATEAANIKQALGTNCLAVHHIGSTAIAGLAAKPVLDIIPVVQDILALDTKALEDLGYTVRGELGMPFRRFFQKGGYPQHSHHLHIWEKDSPEITKHLLFRDYLHTHPADKAAYAVLKHTLCGKI